MSKHIDYQKDYGTPEQYTGLERLTGSYIADILRVRNAALDEWMLDMPIIVRLETCDIAVRPVHAGNPPLRLGSIDTDAPVAPREGSYGDMGQPTEPDNGNNPFPVLRWESYRVLSPVIGERMERLSVHTGERGSTVELDIVTGSGDCMRIVAGTAACTIRTIRDSSRGSTLPSSFEGECIDQTRNLPTWSLPVRFRDPQEVLPVLAS